VKKNEGNYATKSTVTTKDAMWFSHVIECQLHPFSGLMSFWSNGTLRTPQPLSNIKLCSQFVISNRTVTLWYQIIQSLCDIKSHHHFVISNHTVTLWYQIVHSLCHIKSHSPFVLSNRTVTLWFQVAQSILFKIAQITTWLVGREANLTPASTRVEITKCKFFSVSWWINRRNWRMCRKPDWISQPLQWSFKQFRWTEWNRPAEPCSEPIFWIQRSCSPRWSALTLLVEFGIDLDHPRLKVELLLDQITEMPIDRSLELPIAGALYRCRRWSLLEILNMLCACVHMPRNWLGLWTHVHGRAHDHARISDFVKLQPLNLRFVWDPTSFSDPSESGKSDFLFTIDIIHIPLWPETVPIDFPNLADRDYQKSQNRPKIWFRTWDRDGDGRRSQRPRVRFSTLSSRCDVAESDSTNSQNKVRCLLF
jgi:hypothetical protein